MLKIIPLGGLGEIGLNMMVVEYQDTLFIIDAGLMFPEAYMLGVDIVIPKFDYIKNKKSQIGGIILTHAHEDHIGALPYLIKEIRVPVFATPFTLGIVKYKLEEHDLINAVPLHEIVPGKMLKMGPFEIDFIRVSHSVVDGIGLAINTPFGTIIHTGDFKIGQNETKKTGSDLNRFSEYGHNGVLALFSDSTNAEKQGYTISDEAVGQNLKQIIHQCDGRVIVALFASNIARIQQIVEIVKERGRKIIFNGRSIDVSVTIAKQLGYINIPPGMEIDLSQISDYADDEIVMITTGSQGEPMSALARMATGTHKQIKIKEGDTIILSSKFIPGNEKAIAKIINNLFKQGADVVYEKLAEVHVSGHGFREELKTMINLTMPRFFIPIHGEYRHLIHHARIAESAGIPKENILIAENGRTIEIDHEGVSLGEQIETGRILIDGKGIGDVGTSVLKERRMLSEDGMVVVTLAFDEETGSIVYGPEIMSRGFVFSNETGYLLEDAKCVILEIVEEIVHNNIPDPVEEVRSKVKSALKKYFHFTIKRRPLILPFIMEV